MTKIIIIILFSYDDIGGLMKNKIFINKNDHPSNHNQKVYNLNNKSNDIRNDTSITRILNELLNENGYLFNKQVDIVTNDKIYHTSIVNVMKNVIITMDKDVILIKDIQDIKRVS